MSPLELADLAIDGEEERFHDRLSQCVSAPSRTTADDRALTRAAQFGRHGMVDALLAVGADPNWEDASGDSSLTWTARYIHTDDEPDPLLDEAKARIAMTLLDAGAEIGHVGSDSHTALTMAALGGFPKVTEVLIERGAEVDHQDDFGSTALHSAAAQGYEAVVRVLLDAGADTAITDSGGATPLDLARAQGHDAIVRLLEDS